MALFDWLIVVIVIVILVAFGVYTKRYTRSVAGFLSAERCAGRYLLTSAELMAAVSASLFVASFQQFYRGGFPIMWWGYWLGPISLVTALSGWVVYRFRETRALTLAQFFEMRYSRKFRLFTGFLICISGLLNYGIHPAITARLLIYFCGLPTSFSLVGFEVSTFPVVMFIMLSIALTLTFSGGQIVLMVTDFLHSQFTLATVLVVAIFLLCKFDWSNVVAVLKTAPPGQSMLNPFDQARVADFNIWFVAITGFFSFYYVLAWQGNQGYFSAAKNPHEAKMATILARFRYVAMSLIFILVPIIAYVIFHDANYAADAQAINVKIGEVSNKYLQNQMNVPLAFAHVLPVGLLGAVAAVFIGASISTDDTYMHSWGCIFVQDVLLPLRKKPLSQAQHSKWIRISIISVAVFAFIFSMIFPLRDFILMYWYISMSIFTAGAGSVIIGGLYWKRGTTLGAWGALLTGGTLCATGVILRTFWANLPYLSRIATECPLNGMQMTFFAAIASIAVYVTLSLLDKKPPFNLERMLHRGKYAIEGEHVKVVAKIGILRKLTGIDDEFTRGDKIIALASFFWYLFWIVAAVVGSVLALIYKISDDAWGAWWYFVIIFMLVVSIIVACCLFIGGVRDMKQLFSKLRTAKHDSVDDGTVVGHHNLADEKFGITDD